MTLAQLQCRLVAALANPKAQAPWLAPGRLTAGASLAIYRSNRRQAELAALAQVFPIVVTVLGRSCFLALAGRFLDQGPRQGRDLNRYGRGFGPFLAEQPQLQDYPYLAHLAAMEYGLNLAYYAPDTPPWELAALARVPQPEQGRIRLRLRKDLHLLASPWPLYQLWHHHQRGKLGAELARTGHQYLLLHRQGFKPVPRLLSRPLYTLLHALASGAPLAALARQPPLLEQLPEAARQGWLAGFTLEAEDAG